MALGEGVRRGCDHGLGGSCLVRGPSQPLWGGLSIPECHLCGGRSQAACSGSLSEEMGRGLGSGVTATIYLCCCGEQPEGPSGAGAEDQVRGGSGSLEGGAGCRGPQGRP